jgi:hypothetical protein
MAKYVLATQNGTGHAGSVADPYSAADFYTFNDNGGVDTFYLRGTFIYDRFFGGGPGPGQGDGSVFKPWDFSLYGPFIMHITEVRDMLIYGTWENCILDYDIGGKYFMPHSNSVYRSVNLRIAGNLTLVGQYYIYFNGCNIWPDNYTRKIRIPAHSLHVFTDCHIDFSLFEPAITP